MECYKIKTIGIYNQLESGEAVNVLFILIFLV